LKQSRLFALLCGGLLGFLLSPPPAGGQIVSQIPRTLLNFPREALEHPIDRATYQIVPGDIFALGLWGIADTVLTVGVGPEGTLVVPSVGVLNLAGETLAGGEKLVTDRVREVFPSARITLSLISMGTFRVEVTGLVARPGGYPATGVQRVRDVLMQAGDLLPGGSHRGVQVVRNGVPQEIDLVRWVMESDASQNPRLEPGMRIHVPPRESTFRLRGPIEGGWEPVFPPQRSSGPLDRLPQPPQIALEWKEGDTVQEAIRRAGGLSPEAVLDVVYLWRYEPGTRRALIPEVVELGHDVLEQVPVHPGDLVDIPYRGEWVAVTGAVNGPGRYPFLAGWTARDYVNAAGGPSSIGRGGGWKVVREGEKTKGLDPNDPVAPGDVIMVPQTLSHKASAWLATASTAVALVLSIIALAK
jgi:protein involved in polysaccharide export with SLBB domain